MANRSFEIMELHIRSKKRTTCSSSFLSFLLYRFSDKV